MVSAVDVGVNNDNDVHDDNDKTVCDPRKASAELLKAEQRSDKSLAGCWSLAERHKAGYFIRDGILYRMGFCIVTRKCLATNMSNLFYLLAVELK